MDDDVASKIRQALPPPARHQTVAAEVKLESNV
jgi:hypothetical protein